MKMFFNRLLFFISLNFTIVIVLTLCLHFILKKAYQPASYRFKDLQTIIAGDSHTHCALDPKEIPGARNFSFYSEPYLATYQKVKLLLENNSHVKTLILSVGIHKFAQSSKGNDEIIDNNQNLLFYDRYNRIIDFSEFKAKKDLKYWIAFAESYGYPSKNNLKIAFKILIGKFKNTDLPFWGGFTKRPQKRLSVKVVELTLQRHYGNKLDRIVSDSTSGNFIELKKICNLASSHGVCVYLFASPVSSSYYNGIPSRFKTAFFNGMHSIETSVPNVQLIDYSQVQVPDSCFIDADHLNYNGAELISRKLNSEIKMTGNTPQR